MSRLPRNLIQMETSLHKRLSQIRNFPGPVPLDLYRSALELLAELESIKADYIAGFSQLESP